jgi:hypothetical protein
MTKDLPNEKRAELERILKDQSIPVESVIDYIKKECRDFSLSPMLLGLIFERYAKPEDGFSKEITIDELLAIHPGFLSTNGCGWARSDNSWLGKKYIIIRGREKNRVSSIKLDGFNDDSIKRFRGVSEKIKNALKGRKCCILDVDSHNEIDHKNGRYNTINNIDSTQQNPDDFQVLSKAANDAKRQHCKECIANGKRYDATRLGYQSPFVRGSFDTKVCVGCYWFDPHHFNEIISKDFKPDK